MKSKEFEQLTPIADFLKENKERLAYHTKNIVTGEDQTFYKEVTVYAKSKETNRVRKFDLKPSSSTSVVIRNDDHPTSKGYFYKTYETLEKALEDFEDIRTKG